MRKALFAATLLALTLPAFAADKFAGTWKMNTAKSTGSEVPTVAQLVSVTEGKLETITVDETIGGSPIHTEFSVPTAGGPGTIIHAAFTSVSATKATSTVHDLQFMIDGKPAMTVHSVLSADGKTMTTTREVTSGPAKPGTYVDVWERQ